MSLRVGMLTHWFDPEGGAAAGPGTIARALSTQGLDVEVLTGFPIYPSGRVFPGYALRPYLREVMDGIPVHRTLIYPSHDSRAGHRMANYASYALSSSLAAPWLFRHFDVLFVYSSPATAAAAALVTKAQSLTPFVVHIQDLWPDTVVTSDYVESKEGGRVEAALHRFCDAVYRRAHSIAVISPGMHQRIEARGIPSEKIHFIPNWAEDRSFYPTTADDGLRTRLRDGRRFSVMYAGNLGELQGLETVVETATLLSDHPEVGIALVGDGTARGRLEQEIAQRELQNIRIHPPEPFSRMAQVLACGDAQLITLKDSPLYRITLPSKLQANMAVGKPIISAVAGDVADVIESAGCGTTVEPGNPRALADAILTMSQLRPEELAVLGTAARTTYQLKFAESVVSARLADLLRAAAASGRRRS